ncbi:hypothetical protein GCM10011607_12800 [Shewanella inventionis]|uniref:Uncharacterized protein n=1 Tax=Shewanella inventionis TaxID=1738770 RepID=A0ABQ1IXJ1_9GAMM|nr:hypothetical protein [Shewanella inventionis]GGB53658.1 hypothetical protein GCM10011607_12800 [Shewanella inventionis]
MRKKSDFYPLVAEAALKSIEDDHQKYEEWRTAVIRAISELRSSKLADYPSHITTVFRQFTDSVNIVERAPVFGVDLNIDTLTNSFNDESISEMASIFGEDYDLKKVYQNWFFLEKKLAHCDLQSFRSVQNPDGCFKLTLTDEAKDLNVIIFIDEHGKVDSNNFVESNHMGCWIISDLNITPPAGIPLTSHSKSVDPLNTGKLKKILKEKEFFDEYSAEIKLFIATLCRKVLEGVKVDLTDFSELISNIPASLICEGAEIYNNNITDVPDDTEAWAESLRHLHRLIIKADKSCNYENIIDDMISGVIATSKNDDDKAKILISLAAIKDDGSRFGLYLENEASKFLMLSQAWKPAIELYNEEQACLSLSAAIDEIISIGTYTAENVKQTDLIVDVKQNNSL